jgi:cyanophycinase-like exopeptidase
VSGAIALVGSGGFTPGLESVDRELLAATGRRRPRVVVLTVVAKAKEREEAKRTAEMGRQHFAALGAEVEPVALATPADADDPANAQAVGEADLVYIVARRSEPVCRSLTGSAVGRAIGVMYDRGGTIAACEGAAVALGEYRLGPRRRIGWPFGARPGLGLLPGVAIVPTYESRPEVLRLPPILRAPRGTLVVGIDRETALLGDGLAWQVQGRGRVTVWRGRRRIRHRDGDILRFDGLHAPVVTGGAPAPDTAVQAAVAPSGKREAGRRPTGANGDSPRAAGEPGDAPRGDTSRAPGARVPVADRDRGREEMFVDS